MTLSASWLARSLGGRTPCGPLTGDGGGSGDHDGARGRGALCWGGGWGACVHARGSAAGGSGRLPLGGHRRVEASSHTFASTGRAITDCRLLALESGRLEARLEGREELTPLSGRLLPSQESPLPLPRPARLPRSLRSECPDGAVERKQVSPFEATGSRPPMGRDFAVSIFHRSC